MTRNCIRVKAEPSTLSRLSVYCVLIRSKWKPKTLKAFANNQKPEEEVGSLYEQPLWHQKPLGHPADRTFSLGVISISR